MKPVVKEIYLENENTSEDGHPIEATQLKPITTIGSDTVSISSEEPTAVVFVNGSNRGRVKLNSKGNISLESDNKHVNIEAAKGIQFKPTTNVIFDSSRRMDAGKGNEVHLQFLDDDHDSDNPGHGHDQEEYAAVKYEGRSHDIRCLEHGGIALQPAGEDSTGKENKIKFESDRTTEIETSGEYNGEGGKGTEFGTFNNLHTSLYTGDYRMRGKSPIMAVTRDSIESSDGKSDYPTQGDDFKDIPLSYKISGSTVTVEKCTWNNSTGWTANTGYKKLEASLAEIVFLVNILKSGEATEIETIKNLLIALNSAIN